MCCQVLRRLSLLMVTLIVLTSALPAGAAPLTSLEKESMYAAAITDLETYLESYGKSGSSLWGIEQVFDRLGGYEHSRSLMYYTQVLAKVAEEEYDFDLDILLDMLEHNLAFNEYLDDALKGSAIRSVSNLKNYVTARELEHGGRNQEALEYYRQCLSFFDANDRYYHLTLSENKAEYDRALSLLRQGDYAGAYTTFAAVSNYGDSAARMAAIVNQLGYTPASAQDNPQPVKGLKPTVSWSSIDLSWTAPAHATGYKIACRVKGTKGVQYRDYQQTSVRWTGLKPNTTYELTVIAVCGNVETTPCVFYVTTAAQPTPTPRPTKTPTPRPTKTPTPRPTKTPTPRPTKTPTPKPRTFNVLAPSASKGVTTIKWEDNANLGPYTVIVQHMYASGGTWKTAKAVTFANTSGKSASSSDVMVPGEPYSITVKDKNGKTATRQYIPTKQTYPDFKISTSMELKTLTPRGQKNQKSLSAADIKKNIGSYTYGGIIKLSFPQVKYERRSNWTIAFLTPNGDTLISQVFEWYIPREYRAWQWSHYSFNYLFNTMISRYGSVPTGRYTWALYFDGQQASSATFNVTK